MDSVGTNIGTLTRFTLDLEAFPSNDVSTCLNSVPDIGRIEANSG
jgi:hypothetical protein